MIAKSRIAIWLLGAIGLLGLLLLLTVVGGWFLARPAKPDAFYDWPDLPPAESGQLLRVVPFTRGAPPGSRAWRILYVTSRIDGSPAVASAVVMTSASSDPRPRPVIAWAHGTTGLARGCAPSTLKDPYKLAPGLADIIREGWVYVASDYVGLGTRGGHAYLVGDDAARAVLDAVRAARRLKPLRLDGRTVVWGHSQGGGAALWTGTSAPTYAPDVPLSGVAALAPASDLPALVEASGGSMFGKIVSAYLVRAYDETYPGTGAMSQVRPGARLMVADIAGRCAGGLETLLSAAETALLPKDGIFERPPREGRFRERLAENIPRGPIPAPLLIAQGASDDLVRPGLQTAYVARLCANGQAVDYRIYPGADHVSLLAEGTPAPAELVAWTRERLAGTAARSTCPPATRPPS